MQRPDSGEIVYRGTEYRASGWPIKSVKLGLALVPEGRRIFGNLTVYENLRLAGFQLSSGEIEQRIKRVYELFSAPGRAQERSLAIRSPAASSKC